MKHDSKLHMGDLKMTLHTGDQLLDCWMGTAECGDSTNSKLRIETIGSEGNIALELPQSFDNPIVYAPF